MNRMMSALIASTRSRWVSSARVVVPVDLGDVGRVEHGREGANGAQIGADPLDRRLVEDARPAGGDEGIVGNGVPCAEVELMEGGQRDQVPDPRDPLLVTSAEADRAELGQGADRLARTAPDGLDPGDQRGPNGAETHAEDGEPSLSRRDPRRSREGALRIVLA